MNIKFARFAIPAIALLAGSVARVLAAEAPKEIAAMSAKMFSALAKGDLDRKSVV